MPPQLSFVTLGARDLSALRAFYRALGWSERRSSSESFASFALGGVTLALYPLELLQAESAPSQAPPLGGAFRGVLLSINVAAPEEVDAVLDLATGAGATAVGAPEDREWGGRSGYFLDPEENSWEVAWNPSIRLDGQGALLQE